jgi:hypothetical protein
MAAMVGFGWNKSSMANLSVVGLQPLYLQPRGRGLGPLQPRVPLAGSGWTAMLQHIAPVWFLGPILRKFRLSRPILAVSLSRWRIKGIWLYFRAVLAWFQGLDRF